jgi:hypothetical protein
MSIKSVGGKLAGDRKQWNELSPMAGEGYPRDLRWTVEGLADDAETWGNRSARK